MSSVQLKFINVAAVNCQYCCSNQQILLLYPANVPSDCNLSTSVRCMQVVVVKNTNWQMYWTCFTSLSCAWLSEAQTTVVCISESKWSNLWSKWPIFDLIFYNIKISPFYGSLASTLPLTGALKQGTGVNFYFNWYRNYERSKLNICFLLSKFQSFIFGLSRDSG